MSGGRGPTAMAEARALIGHRVHWTDTPQHHGTITDVTMSRNGWVRYVIRWDTTAPEGWATVLSPAGKALVIEP